MSNNKWGVAASIVGVAALGGAAATMAYFMMKEEEDFRSTTRGKHVSSRPLSTTVRIPKNQRGPVIGHGGRNIREIQTRTNTRIHFKDELATEEYHFLAVEGLPSDVKLAEILIHQIIAYQPTTDGAQDTFETSISSIYIGAIIGRNGETVRALQDTSGCRIDIERVPYHEQDKKTDRKMVLRGNRDQIKMAKTSIEDLCNEEREFLGLNKGFVLIPKPGIKGDTNRQPIKTTLENEELIITETEDTFEVYVCSVTDPSHFFVQKVGATSVALDKLGRDMTAFYEENSELMKLKGDYVNKGSIIAAKNSLDGSWYRAKVENITYLDEYDDSKVDVDVDFVDFGDFEKGKSLQELRQIKQEYLELKSQAIPASMADIKAVKDSKWSPEAINDFESLTHAAQWKPVLAKIANFDKDIHVNGKLEAKCRVYLKLIDANSGEDIDIGEEMIQRGHAAVTMAAEK